MKIAYTKLVGVAHNIRRVADDYQAQTGELLIEHDSDSVPSAQSLSDPRPTVRRIGYFKTNGRAHDIRIVPEDHNAADGELFITSADALPLAEDLSDPPSLEQLRSAKIAEINAARLSANQSNFMFQDKPIACDPLSRGDIDGVAAYVALNNELPPEFPGAWKTADNNYVEIADVRAFKDLITAMVIAGSNHFAHAQQLKSRLASAKSEQEIQEITW